MRMLNRTIIMFSMTLLLLLLMLTCVNGEFVNNINVIDKKLRTHLLATTSTLTVPVVDKQKPINITLGIEMKKIIEVNEVESKFKIKVWTRMSWSNEFLKWHPDEWGNITWMKVKSHEVWIPDVAPYNDLDEEKGDVAQKYKKLVLIEHNGHNSWYVPVVFTLDCHIQVEYFPFDVQRCPITFGSWEYDIRSMRLQPDSNPVLTADYKNSSLWDILFVQSEVSNITYPCCQHPYSVMSFSFVIHRRSLYFVYNVIIPCTALMIIILMSFFLPPNSGERITVVITVLLALCLFLQFINQSLPKNSDATPVLSVFYIAILVECTMSLVTTCIVLITHHRGNEQWAAPVPKWVKRIFFKNYVTEGGSKYSAEYAVHEKNGGAYANGVKLANGDSEGLLAHHQRHTATTPNCNGIKDDEVKLIPNPPHHDHLLRQMYAEVKKLTSRVLREEIANDIEGEWRYLSAMLDRFFFYLFVCLFALTSVIILVPAYFQHENIDH